MISPKLARSILSEITLPPPLSVNPGSLTGSCYRKHGHVVIGDVAIRGHKDNHSWRVEESEIRRAGRALAELPLDHDDLVDARLPAEHDRWDRRPDWRSQLCGWMTDAAPFQPRDSEHDRSDCGPGCGRPGSGPQGLPCGLTWEHFTARCGERTIAGTRPLAMLTWSGQTWLIPRAYSDLLDRWERVEQELRAKASLCTGCGEHDEARKWRSSGAKGYATLCPACARTTLQVYTGHLRGRLYRSIPEGRRADPYLCQACGERRATCWDHCHDHGYLRGPACAGCNTSEGQGGLFLCREGRVEYLLECPGCRTARRFPARHTIGGAARHLQLTERHGRCPRQPTVAYRQRTGDDAVRFTLMCPKCPDGGGYWHRTLSTAEMEALTRELIDNALGSTARRDNGSGPLPTDTPSHHTSTPTDIPPQPQAETANKPSKAHRPGNRPPKAHRS